MSFEEKSRWLRCNPVTAARHFQYTLNTFFQDVLKSKAKSLGEIVDYAISWFFKYVYTHDNHDHFQLIITIILN